MTPGAEQRTRHLLDRWRQDLGLLNAWQTLHPNCDPPQTLRWTRQPLVPYHCDGIFIDARLLPNLTHAQVIQGEAWTRLSDHNPVVIDLR